MEIIAVFSNEDRADGLGWDFQPSASDDFFSLQIGKDGMRWLWIVYDKIENPSDFIKEKIRNESAQRVYVLYHQNPKKEFIRMLHDDLEGNGVSCFPKKSDHDTPADYKKIADLLEPRPESDEQELVDLFERLKQNISRNKKQKFCEDCGTFENFPAQSPVWVEGIALLHFEALQQLHKESPFNEKKFINKLGELREALLYD